MVSVPLNKSEQQELIKNDILEVIDSAEKALKSLIVPGTPFKLNVPTSSVVDQFVVGGSALLAVDSRQQQGSGSVASIRQSQAKKAGRKKHKESCPHFATGEKSSHSTLSGPLSSMNSATSVSSRKPRPAPLRTLQHVSLSEMADGSHRVHVSVTLPPGTDDDDQQFLLLDFKKDGSVAAVLNGKQLRKALK